MTERHPVGRSVVVVSDEALVADTVRAALTTYGFAHLVAGRPGAEVGLLIHALGTFGDIGEATQLVGGSDIPWVVVTSTPAGPGWGAALAAGASVVVDSSTSIVRVVGLLDELLAGTHGGDPEAERELRRQWEDFVRARDKPDPPA